MESSSFSNLHLITSLNECKGVAPGKNIFYSYIFQIDSSAQVDALLQYIFSKENTRSFSVTIVASNDYNEAGMESWLNKLLLILCHPHYIRDSEKIFLGILSKVSRGYSHQAFLEQLAFELSRQSFNVSFINLNQPGSNNPLNPISYFTEMKLSDEAFKEWYLDNLEKSKSVLQIFVYQSELETARMITQKVVTAEKKILEKTPLIYKIIQTELAFSKEKKELELTIENLKQDLASKKEYLDYLTGRNADGTINGSADLLPSMKIKKFYHQEYEVLPLWYKRLGHVIKVLIGKRTFRSLYNDKTPKYKQ